MKIAIVEDEGITALFLRKSLVSLKHTVSGLFDNAAELLAFLERDQVDLVLMDINIKGATDGIQCARKVYTEYPAISIVFLTSYKDQETICDAQGVKPYGYLIKPVSKSDLAAVLMVVQSHHTPRAEANDIIALGHYRYHSTEHILYESDNIIALSLKEQICLDTLVHNINNYVSSEQLEQSLWPERSDHKGSLRELIFRLRKKLPHLTITTTRNTGYTLTLPSSS